MTVTDPSTHTARGRAAATAAHPDPAGRTRRRPGSRTLTVALLVVGVLALLARGVFHLLHPTFWAEDGMIFYSQGRSMGLASIWQPYAGYLHVLPRLLTLPLVALPVTWGPAATVWTATVADILLMATVMTPRWRWLIASPVGRAGLFVLVVLLPGQYETLNNLANLIFVGGIALAVIALSDPPRTRVGRAAEVAAVVVLGLSGPIVLLLVPLFAYRVGRTRCRQAWVTAVVALGCGVAQLVVYLLSSRSAGSSDATVAMFGKVVLERGPGSWVFGPRLAERIVANPGDLHLLTIVPVLWLAAVVAVWATRGFWFAAATGVTAALLFAAPTWAYGDRMYLALGSNRHVVVPMMLTVTALVAAASTRRRGDPSTGRRRWPAVVAAVLLATGVLGETTLPKAIPWERSTDTASLQRCLATTAPVCQTPISPPGFAWVVIVRGPVPK